MAPSLTIYVDYLSQPCRAIGLLCRAIDAPHNEHFINLMKGEHKKEEYLAVNPFGKAPAVKEGNTVINESCSSLRYIASKYDDSGKWYPQDLEVRAKVDEYLDWQHTNTRKHGCGYFFNKILSPILTKQPLNMVVVNEHKEEMARVEKDFVEYFLANKPFIIGDQVTIADLTAACEFEQPLAGGYDLSQPIRDYLERVQTALGPIYGQIHKNIHDMAKKHSK